MLNNLKEIYLKQLEFLPNHRKLTQIELADGYLNDVKNKDAYLSALILRYWHILDRALYRDAGLYNPEEAYDWYTYSVVRAIKTAPWKDAQSSVFNDPKGVEKVLNTMFNCERANWFQAANRDRRKLNHGMLSLDSIEDDYKDSFLPEDTSQEIHIDSYKYLVQDAFNHQKYLFALMIDVIVHDISAIQFNNVMLINTIRRAIRSLPSNYTEIFASNYEIPLELVGKAFSFIYNMNDSKLRQSIEVYIYHLRILLKRND